MTSHFPALRSAIDLDPGLGAKAWNLRFLVAAVGPCAQQIPQRRAFIMNRQPVRTIGFGNVLHISVAARFYRKGPSICYIIVSSIWGWTRRFPWNNRTL